MKAKVNGFEVEGSVDEIRLLVMPRKYKKAMNLEVNGSKKYQPYTAQELRYIWENNVKGKSVKWIARKLHRTKCAIYTQLTLLKKSKMDSK